MKTLQAYAVINETSNTNTLQNVAAGVQHLDITYENNIEDAVNAMNAQNFQLLIIDKALPDADIKKLNRLMELLHPDAAITAFNLQDEDYIRFKLSGLMLKWEDAQSEGKVNFIDDPEL
ncbi:hypothetical protein [Parafilimonas terrae]|uniref:Response regulator receiver domain-containing protein n=1 Tax=Parafilimonas terrae TaxID=1465490 RepID=A0A1I5UIT2_9BACT|nr:hypothetical protein [Parafilimonas terrae]SFP94967.1 hypothetical protein SAMN05444277_103311 [Parafilimonas terrae]